LGALGASTALPDELPPPQAATDTVMATAAMPAAIRLLSLSRIFTGSSFTAV
jgi:hypothetical protein